MTFLSFYFATMPTMQTRQFISIGSAVAAACLLAACLGCQSTKPTKLTKWNPVKALNSDNDEPKLGVPERVVGAWTEAVRHQANTATRGFGGRLYFYERGTSEPIRVEGRLVVYAFAEDEREPTDNRPTKRYVFPPEQFAKHESESEIGVSYSVWLPWDQVGGEQAEVSLIARFEPLQGGGLVVSDQTRHRLPGRPRQETMIAEQPNRSPVTPASTHADAGEAGRATMSQALYQQSSREATPQMRTTTISLPNGFRGFRGGSSNRSSKSTSSRRVSAHSTAAPQVGAFNQGPAELAPPAPAQSGPAVAPQASLPAGQGTQATPQATPVRTTVEYLTAGESVRKSLRPRSPGSTPTSLPAAGGPTAQPPAAPTR